MRLNDLFTYKKEMKTALSSHEETIFTPQGLSIIPRNGLYLPFHGGSKSHLGLAPSTETGGIIYPTWMDRIAVQLAEATTNLVINPSVEVDLNSWATSGTNTIERSSAQAKIGNWSIKCIFGDTPQLLIQPLTESLLT